MLKPINLPRLKFPFYFLIDIFMLKRITFFRAQKLLNKKKPIISSKVHKILNIKVRLAFMDKSFHLNNFSQALSHFLHFRFITFLAIDIRYFPECSKPFSFALILFGKQIFHLLRVVSYPFLIAII